MGWGNPSPSYAYSYTSGPPSAHRPSTSRTEVVHLTVAYVVLTFDVMLLLGGLYFFEGPVLLYAAIGASAALTGFVAHEMAHKVVAQMGGYWAEFRLSPFGLVLSVITASFGFLFAAPGATMIGGMGNVRDWGRTSLAGPTVNFAFALGLVAASVFLRTFTSLWFAAGVILFIAYINALFAAFNMIPVGPLDGAKVLRWNSTVWALAFVAFAAMTGLLAYFVYVAGLGAL